MGGMVYGARWCFSTNPMSMNESEDPKSTRDIRGVSGIGLAVIGIMRASGVVMEALRVTIVCAQMGEMQPSGGVGLGRLLSLFSPLPRRGTLVILQSPLGLRQPWPAPSGIPWPCVWFSHRTGRGCYPDDIVIPGASASHISQVSQTDRDWVSGSQVPSPWTGNRGSGWLWAHPLGQLCSQGGSRG